MSFGSGKEIFHRAEKQDNNGERKRQRRQWWSLNLASCPQTLTLVGGLQPEELTDLLTSRKVSSNWGQVYGESVTREGWERKARKENKAHMGVSKVILFTSCHLFACFLFEQWLDCRM
jgi:hypothetical protein